MTDVGSVIFSHRVQVRPAPEAEMRLNASAANLIPELHLPRIRHTHGFWPPEADTMNAFR